ncbi:uncharacterized protein LOC111677741 [Lucilia cuprina]|uniref:uncharacterized protein LOC111677741 n=1 Tax=Lucilia cuprina TaxID=7375 RepID=UPI001F05570A|nr:uncharacterized protein LOC111677741 [Lucilia cuprina]
MELKILELFSSIGDMHFAFKCKRLKEIKFYYGEFLLSATQIGVPNTGHRKCTVRKLQIFLF